jgi:heterodisulfide reductase subunit C
MDFGFEKIMNSRAADRWFFGCILCSTCLAAAPMETYTSPSDAAYFTFIEGCR